MQTTVICQVHSDQPPILCCNFCQLMELCIRIYKHSETICQLISQTSYWEIPDVASISSEFEFPVRVLRQHRFRKSSRCQRYKVEPFHTRVKPCLQQLACRLSASTSTYMLSNTCTYNDQRRAWQIHHFPLPRSF